MTRDQITTLVCATVGQTDSTSVSLCNDYVQRAYEMVWNAELWRDTVTIDTSTSVSAGTNAYNMPSGFDRVISLQLLASGSPVGFLEPTTSSFILQTEPSALTVQGIPTKYEEYVHTDGTKKIRLFPVPNASYTLTMVGKRVCPTLGASDSLQVRNVDNAVITLATADMYTRQRQLGKAAEMAKKAGAYLDEARKIEQQSNLPRTSKNITVSGDTLAELTDAVCEKTGLWGPQDALVIKSMIRRNYLRIYDAYLWPESKIIVTASSDGSYIILPSNVGQVLKVRYASDWPSTDVVDLSLYFELNPGIFEETATRPAAFSVLTPIASATLPSTAEAFKVISTSTSDKSNVFLRGENVSGIEVNETIALNGTTYASGSQQILVPLTISKGVTVGTVSIVGVTSGTFWQNLAPNEREKKHIRLWVQPASDESDCLILGKRKIIPLLTDEDTPMIRGIGDALINAACADIWRSKNDNRADQYAAESQKAVQSLIDQFTQQAAYEQRVIPVVEPLAWDGVDSEAWIVAKV